MTKPEYSIQGVKLVEMFHANGLSISYDRVLEISAEPGDAVVAESGYDKWRTSDGEAEGCYMAMRGLQ